MFQETKVSNIVLVLKHRHTTLQCDCLEKEPGNPALSHIDPLQKMSEQYLQIQQNRIISLLQKCQKNIYKSVSLILWDYGKVRINILFHIEYIRCTT